MLLCSDWNPAKISTVSFGSLIGAPKKYSTYSRLLFYISPYRFPRNDGHPIGEIWTKIASQACRGCRGDQGLAHLTWNHRCPALEMASYLVVEKPLWEIIKVSWDDSQYMEKMFQASNPAMFLFPWTWTNSGVLNGNPKRPTSCCGKSPSPQECNWAIWMGPYVAINRLPQNKIRNPWPASIGLSHSLLYLLRNLVIFSWSILIDSMSCCYAPTLFHIFLYLWCRIWWGNSKPYLVAVVRPPKPPVIFKHKRFSSSTLAANAIPHLPWCLSSEQVKAV